MHLKCRASQPTIGVCSLPGVAERRERERDGDPWKTPDPVSWTWDDPWCRLDRSRCAGVYPIVSYTSYSNALWGIGAHINKHDALKQYISLFVHYRHKFHWQKKMPHTYNSPFEVVSLKANQTQMCYISRPEASSLALRYRQECLWLDHLWRCLLQSAHGGPSEPLQLKSLPGCVASSQQGSHKDV